MIILILMQVCVYRYFFFFLERESIKISTFYVFLFRTVILYLKKKWGILEE